MPERRAIARRVTDQIRPIVIGGFSLTASGMVTRGRPSFQEYEAVGNFIKYAHKCSPWWLADWLRYGETREDWTQKLSQAVDATGLSAKTLKNMRAIGAIDQEVRRPETVDFSLHDAVCGMAEPDQIVWLERAETEGWTLRELRLAIRASKRRAVIEGQAVLEGMYRVIYADPSWPYGDRPPSGMGAEQHYPTMSIEDICKLPVAAHAMPDSVLFMWETAPLVHQIPGPRDVGEAWGFTYKQQWIWDKVDRNFGHYSNGNHEILTIWTRGSCLPDVPNDLPDSVVTVRKSPEHSGKPEEFRRLIEKHWTSGPYLELFGRERHEGWSVFGNDARLWAQEAATE
jgi:N6-adenosine-specific RNA methylase IME4